MTNWTPINSLTNWSLTSINSLPVIAETLGRIRETVVTITDSVYLPLLLQNCDPLSFLDVQQDDYALAVLGVYEQQNAFTDLLRQELTYLEAFNCARYRLGIPQAERWVQAGRPGI